MDYLKLGYDALSENPSLNITSRKVDGHKVWIKKSSVSKKTIWHYIQSFFAKILNQPILSATAITQDTYSVLSEVKRIEAFREQGVLAPEVYAADESIMVLSHCGDTLTTILNEKADGRRDVLLKAVAALADLHGRGLVHGKPYLRDMTMQDDKIGFIDLEEDPLRVMSLPQAQARDVWLFMSFAAKYARMDGDKYSYDADVVEELFNKYKELGNADTIEALQSFVGFLAPIGRVLEKKFFWRKIGSDARRAVFASRLLLT